MQHFSAERIAALLTYGEIADAIGAAFADGNIRAPQRWHLTSETDPNDALLIMPAWRPGGVGIVKAVTVRSGNAARGLATVQGTALLFDEASGTPLATVDATALTRWRTAATSLLAARRLARPESSIMAMVGSGAMADHLLRAFSSEFALREVLIWSRTAAHARGLAAAIGLPKTVRVSVVDDLESAVRRADIVSCATLAESPLVFGAWVKSGAHVDLVGAFRPTMRESDDTLIQRARIYVDTRAGALSEAGDLVRPLRAGVIRQSDVLGELADLVREDRRSDENAVTLFKSVGHSIEDLATAERLMDAAAAVSRET
jgi:ornithine cyclodeaminase